MDQNAVENRWPWNFGNFLLATRRALSIGSTGDAGSIGIALAQYRVRKIVVRSPSASVSGAFLAVWTAAGGTGTNLVANAQLTNLTTALTFQEMTLTATANLTIFTAAALFINVGTASSGNTVDIDIYGDPIPDRM
jgi:hypothetical protein